MSSERSVASINYDLPRPGIGWELSETLPSSLLHDEIVTRLRAILTHWAARFRPDVLVARELAVRWDRERPAHGVDPDIAVFPVRPPADRAEIRSMCTWKEGQAPPLFAVEVVSDTEPRKDYTIAPDKYAASGARELVVFDPLLAGPKSHGGPFRLQVWRRAATGAFARVYAGDGPSYSEALGAYLLIADEGRLLRLSQDAAGEHLWLTAEEAERASAETERAKAEAARARVAELEAQLAEMRRGRPSSE